MPGFKKLREKREIGQWGHRLHASRYDDPRGGRLSALERNILRYRAVEASLYLFYSEEVRDFMLTDIYPAAVRTPDASPWEPSAEVRVERKLARVISDAEKAGALTAQDVAAIRQQRATDRRQGKKLKVAFGYAIKIGAFTDAEAEELHKLLDYMGMTLRSAQHRQRTWINSGGLARPKVDVTRYDVNSGRRLKAESA
jgi:hypothetical protein